MKYLLIMFLTYTNCFAQVPFGRIHFDLTKFDKNDNLSIIPEKNMIKQLNDNAKSKININIGWINSESEIYENLKDNSDNSNIVHLDKDHEPCIGDQVTTCRRYFFGGSVNFHYNANAMHVSLIKLNDKLMYIYMFTGIPEQRIKHGLSEITDVFFDDFEFVEGTFLINLSDKNLKSSISDYYVLSNSSLIVKNKGLNVSKLSSATISPEELDKFCNNPNLKQSKTIKNILSVFKS